MLQTAHSAHTIQTLPRQAEHGDTRMALQRREEESGHRQSPRKKAGKDVLSNDEANVSLEALGVFLENLIRAHETRAERDAAVIASGTQATILTPPARTNAAMPSAIAARAYANASRTISRHEPAMETAIVTPAKPLAATAQTRLSTAERGQIDQIRENIALLTQRGIENLSIQRGETFLGSILEATRTALEG